MAQQLLNELEFGSAKVRGMALGVASQLKTKQEFAGFLRYALECYQRKIWQGSTLPNSRSLDLIVKEMIQTEGKVDLFSIVKNLYACNYLSVDAEDIVSNVILSIEKKQRRKKNRRKVRKGLKVVRESGVEDTIVYERTKQQEDVFRKQLDDELDTYMLRA